MPSHWWLDLLDPDESALDELLPFPIHHQDREMLLAPSVYRGTRTLHRDEPRPRLEARNDYIFGVLVVPKVIERDGERDIIYTQELNVLLDRTGAVLIRKTPQSQVSNADLELLAYDTTSLAKASAQDPARAPGLFGYRLIDDIAEEYLHLFDAVSNDIDELEERIDTTPSEDTRNDLRQMRSDLLTIRRSLGPTRDAVRAVITEVVDLGDDELFTEDVEVRFRDAYDKLVRASDGLEFCREMLAGLRDFHESKIGLEQNEVINRLSVMASLLLVPTLIAGILGENLRGIPLSNAPGGFWWSILLIVLITVAQLAFFKRKGWV